MSRLATRMERIRKSATMAASEKAGRLRRQGVDVIDLGPGEPDFDTPEHILEAAAKAMAEGHTRYTPVSGISELREAIAEFHTARDGVVYEPQETIVTCGGKQAIHSALMAVVNPGDEVVLPTPYWVSFPEQIRMLGGEPVFVDRLEEDGFRFGVSAIEAACTDRTRVIIVNTPCNPTGAVASLSEIETLTRLAIERDLLLLFDECYAQLVYDGAEHVSPLVVGKEAKAVTLICGSCSKSYAMTGWRVGYGLGPREVIEAMARLQSHTTSNASSVSQWAALTALTADQSSVEEMRQAFDRRRHALLPLVRGLPGVSCAEPQGAFYFFPNVSELLSEELPTAADLAARLIDEAHVVTVPGTAFGRDGYLRLSYAASLERLEEALERLRDACAELRA